MDAIHCPHCKNHRIVAARVPKDVVVVMPCPSCHELFVVFRDKVIALSRRILERGTFEERKTHLAGVIARFLESGIFPGMGIRLQRGGMDDAEGFDGDDGLVEEPPEGFEDDTNPILDEEFEKFVRIDLKCLDNSAYFRRHFG